jgi:peroxiredoxin
MLRRTLLLLLTVGLSASLLTASLPPGKPLVDMPISQTKGRKIDLKQYRGKAVVLVMVSLSCAHCIEALETLNQLQAQLGPQGLQVVGAAGDLSAEMNVDEFAKNMHLTFPMGFVDQAGFMKLSNLTPDARPFVPVLMFIDPKGMVRVQYFGDNPLIKDKALNEMIRKVTGELMKELPAAK